MSVDDRTEDRRPEGRRMRCNCWVSRATEFVRFVARRGGHSVSCPGYRESRDPVDRAEDTHNRMVGERGEVIDGRAGATAGRTRGS